MGMHGYFHVFPEKAKTELRTATFVDANGDDLPPDGQYIFDEYFCTDLNCNCQRVLVKVFRVRSEDSPPSEVATISYSWNPNSDETWTSVNSGVANPFLDPFHRQASYAAELLDFWRMMVTRDRAYAARLERHYDEIRAEIGRSGDDWEGSRSPGSDAAKTPFRPLTKRERKARDRRLARARKRK